MHYERVRAEVNLDAIANNVREIRKNIKAGTKLIAVVKADGYGHGAVQVAKAALAAGADELAVAILEEGIELRNSGIEVPVIILGAAFPEHSAEIIKHDLYQSVFSLESAKALAAEAKAQGKTAKIQIKLDTGMSRIGFQPEAKDMEEIAEIFALENVEVMSIFTHLSCADSSDKAYARMQNERFCSMLEELKKKGISLPPVHISNSAAIMDLPEYNYDAVRAGIILYGILPSDEVNKTALNLRQAMSIKARISHVKTLKPGECVSYGAHFRAARETIVATIPVGYADGHSRHLSNKGRVLVKGQYAPIIGNVCMDQFMIDVTDIAGVRVGDEAVLMGAQGDEMIYANDIGDLTGTIGYEVVCRVTKRVPRLYMQDGKPLV